LLVAALLERKFTRVFQGVFIAFWNCDFSRKKIFSLSENFLHLFVCPLHFCLKKTGETEKMGVEITNGKSTV
jgi:hypothetical protein